MFHFGHKAGIRRQPTKVSSRALHMAQARFTELGKCVSLCLWVDRAERLWDSSLTGPVGILWGS